MTIDPNSDLERRVDRALKHLPRPAAPDGLLGRVMRAVEASAPSGAAAAMFEWPAALRIALCALSVAVVVAAWFAWPFALDVARASRESSALVLVRVAAAAVRPLVPAGLLYVAAMCAASAAAASLLKHVALGGASRS